MGQVRVSDIGLWGQTRTTDVGWEPGEPGRGGAGHGRLGRMLAGIELGGTKIACLVGTGPDDIVDECRIPTRDPATTLAEVRAFLEGHAVEAIGIASFGPIELRNDHSSYGHITRTTKPGWSDTDVVSEIRGDRDLPVGFETDVNGAALGEGRWGAAAGLRLVPLPRRSAQASAVVWCRTG